ncbi:MAG TPA: hypothetical protein VH092_38410, partial [Urbifossiella sp.]|nr:hypothetical protein [Urbifossiella sp.]
MRLCIVHVLALGSLTSVLAQEPRVTEEMGKLQGTWVRVHVVIDGKKTDDGKREPDREVILKINGDRFDGDKYTL